MTGELRLGRSQPRRSGSPDAAAARAYLGMRLIVGYKLVKASLEVAGAMAIMLVGSSGLPSRLVEYGSALHEHLSPEWSRRVSEMLTSAEEPRHLRVAALALALDGAMTVLEGISLGRGWWWGPWLVVAATTTLLPVEIVGLLHHGLEPLRLAVLVANVVVVVYLGRHALRRRGGGRGAG